jgi:hypothetical protein
VAFMALIVTDVSAVTILIGAVLLYTEDDNPGAIGTAGRRIDHDRRHKRRRNDHGRGARHRVSVAEQGNESSRLFAGGA